MEKKVKNKLVDDESIIIDEVIKNAPKERIHFIDRSSEIVEQIYRVLETKGWKQKDLATVMNKSDAEVSKWLKGGYNFTLRTLAHIEVALGENIIYTKAGKELENELLCRKETVFYATINSHGPNDSNFQTLIPKTGNTNSSTKAA